MSVSLETRIEENMGFIRNYAKKWTRPGIERADLEQEGILGLIEGHKKYNETIGRYTTFVGWYIKRNIRLEAYRKHLIRIPCAKLALVDKFYQVQNRLEASSLPCGFEETCKELAKIRYIDKNGTSSVPSDLDLTEKEKRDILHIRNMQHTISTSVQNNDDEKESPLDKIDPEPSESNKAIIREMVQHGYLTKGLPPRTKKILYLYDGGEGKTQTEIAAEMGLTPARICQLLKEAENTIREKLYA